MKVIKSGNTKEKFWSKECICSKCHALLLVNYEDVFQMKNEASSVYNNLPSYNLYFACPECLNNTFLACSDIPAGNFPIRTAEFKIL